MAYSLAGTTRPTVLSTPSVSHDDADHHEASVHAWIVAVRGNVGLGGSKGRCSLALCGGGSKFGDMGHVDPVFAIPVGLVFAVGGALLALQPERFLGVHGWPRTLERVFGPRLAVAVVRLSGVALAAMTSWFVVHGVATGLS
jgi:hypothetical protein